MFNLCSIVLQSALVWSNVPRQGDRKVRIGLVSAAAAEPKVPRPKVNILKVVETRHVRLSVEILANK